MTRHRAQRLVEVARSKGVEAKYIGSAPSRPGASSPWLYLVLLKIPEQPLTAWCYNTKHFFTTLRHLLSVQKACRP